MSTSKVGRIGNLQLKILKLLWELSEATVAQIHSALGPKADLAYTTIATMLRKMEVRNLVTHRIDGRIFIYRAVVAEGDVTRGLADDLIERVFEGSLSSMVAHLLTTRDVSTAELHKIEALIAARKKAK